MKVLKEVEPDILVGTSQFNLRSSRTVKFLHKTLIDGEWSLLPPVYAVKDEERVLVLDGNRRRNFAQENSLLIPEVAVILTDEDWMQVKDKVETVYTKVTRVDQLVRLLRDQIEE